MSQKIQYATVIFPDHVYEEIQLLQKELSHKDDKIWNISDTTKLLLQFCLEENDGVYAQNYSFLREYTYEKESFLKDFTSSVLRSIYVTDYETIFWLGDVWSTGTLPPLSALFWAQLSIIILEFI